MVEQSTFCGCLLLAAIADLRACSKMRSWFSVFTDCSMHTVIKALLYLAEGNRAVSELASDINLILLETSV